MQEGGASEIAGKPKQGLDYAGWATDIFDGDTKIDRLLDAQGWFGFAIYFYLCQMAYKFDGYFYRWAYADSASTARRMGGGVRSGTVEETVRTCLQIGLFDNGLFDRWGILTSRGIQRRFRDAVQKRRAKSVIADYWLLEEEESKGLAMCAQNASAAGKSPDSQSANAHLHPAHAPIKESKGKIDDDDDMRARDISLVCRCYEQNMGGTVPRAAGDDIRWYLESGYERGLLCAAIESAAVNNARSWAYVRAILRGCEKDGVRTRAAYEGAQAARAQRRERQSAPHAPQRRGRGNKFLEMLEHERSTAQEDPGGHQLRVPELERGTGAGSARNLDDVDWGSGCQ